MIKEATIAEILALYEKHGWILRRVLLSEPLKNSFAENPQTIFGAAEIVSSEIDGLWFSRVSKHGEAWELRRLTDAPFALVVVLDPNAGVIEREMALAETQHQMLEKIG